MSSGFFVARNFSKEIEDEVEQIFREEQERIRNEREAEEREKEEKEAELIRLGVKKPKKKTPSFLAKLDAPHSDESKGETGENDFHTFSLEIQKKITSLNSIKSDMRNPSKRKSS